jgi:copper transporter 1
MLLNWHTIDACFLSSAFRIRSPLAFFGTCFGAFLLVFVLEFLRRVQREFDAYLRTRDVINKARKYSAPDDPEEKLLAGDIGGRTTSVAGRHSSTMNVMLEQGARGVIHMVQFGVSYCIMLLFMYSNGTYLSLTSAFVSGINKRCRLYHYFYFAWGASWICTIHSRYVVSSCPKW